MKEMSLEYICTHLYEEEKVYNAVTPPLTTATLHVFDRIEDLLSYNCYNDREKYIYGRVDNPTIRLLEKKLAAVEGADDSVCFASGMAAITSALLYALKPGDHLITLKNVYGPARTFIEKNLAQFGITCTFVSGLYVSEFEEVTKENTRMIYLESPTSAVMELQDLRQIAAFAKSKNIVTAIDNTWAAGVYQKPLALGIDMSVHTISKYYGGHSDVIAGVLMARDEIVRKIRDEGRELYGGIIGAFEAWQVLRSMRTLPARLKQSSENALAVAQMLEKRREVKRVNYPTLKSYSQAELAKEQLSGASGLFSFELDMSLEDTLQFANKLKLFQKGVSWGGFESLCCMPMYKHSDEVCADRNSARNLIRLYCGLEGTDDLLEDVERAFT